MSHGCVTAQPMRQAAPAPRRAGRWRRIVTGVLVVATSLVVTVAVAGVWVRRNALDTDRWVETVGPVIEKSEVRAALRGWMTTELMGVVDPEMFFDSALPEGGRVLAVPLTNALRGFVDDTVDAFLGSDAFQRLWVEVNERAHERAVAVLEGGTVRGLEIEGDNVVLNLIPALTGMLGDLDEASPEIFGRTVDLPTITVDDLPEDAVRRLEDALGRDIPDDFGRFTVFEASRLRQVQDAVDLLNRFVVATLVAAIVLLGVTHWVAPRRRRTLLQVTVGIALGVAVVRRLGIRLGDTVVDFVRPENQDALEAVIDAFVSTLTDTTAWILGIAALVATVAVLTGPYRWARALRRRTGSFARTLAVSGGGDANRRSVDPAAAWVGAHKQALLVGRILAAIVALLVVDLSWLGLLLLALLVGGFELVVWRIAQIEPTAGEPREEAPVIKPS